MRVVRWRNARLWLSAGWLMLGLACGDAETPATQVLVVVYSDLALGEQLSRIEASVQSADGVRTVSAPFPFALAVDEERPEGKYSLPLSFGILKPPGGANTFRVVITGFGPLGPEGSEVEVIEQKAIASFQQQRTLRLTVFLGSVCLQKACDADVACYPTAEHEIDAGACGPLQAPALDRVEPHSELQDIPSLGSGEDAGHSGSSGQPGAGTNGPDSNSLRRITAGTTHTCVITASGAAKCWGDNALGQLGDGTVTQQGSPVDVLGLSRAVEIAAGAGKTCALLDSSSVKCWGRETTNTAFQMRATEVTSLSRGVLAIDVGGRGAGSIFQLPHACALLDTGAVKCWGHVNPWLGEPIAAPMDVVDLVGRVGAIAVGGAQMCALLTTGGVKCRGDGKWPGNAGGTYQSTPVDVAGLSGVVALAAGGEHTCALLTTGAVKCWGDNSFGQLGSGQSGGASGTPIDVLGLSSGVAAIAAGGTHSCALLRSGGVKCWGSDNQGQLGDGGSNADQATPVDVFSLSRDVTAIAAGGAPASFLGDQPVSTGGHTCALLASGTVKCWGGDSYGQLGNGGGVSHQSIPVDVVGLP